MKLPGAEDAEIPPEKLGGYLLSPTHPIGRYKAEFFSRFGFSATNWEILADALRRHAASHDVELTDETPYGTRYTVEGSLESPDGRHPRVRVVWFLAVGAIAPRLITSFPSRGRSTR